MPIEKLKDPRTRREITIVSGVVEGIWFNKLKQIKTYNTEKGTWTPTHSTSIIVDGVRVSMGLTDKESINAKDVDGNYHALKKGAELSVELTEVGEYNGKPSYSSKSSKITVLDVSGAVDEVKNKTMSGGEQGNKKYDSTAIVAGNARSAAANWVSRDLAKIDQLMAVVEDFAIIGDRQKKQLSESGMSEWEVGVSVGQALLAASLIVKSIEDIDAFVETYVNTYIRESIEIIKRIHNGEQDIKVSKNTKNTKPIDDVDDIDNVDALIPF